MALLSAIAGTAKQRAFRLVRRPTARTVLGVGVVACLCYLIIGPLLMLLGSSFQRAESGLPLSPGATWTLDNYQSILGDPATYAALARTAVFGLGALSVAFALAGTFAWLVARTDLPAPSLVFVLLVAPSGMPFLIVAIAWSILLNPTNGLLNQILSPHLGLTLNIYSMPGMIFVQGMGMVPITFLLLLPAMRAMSSSLEDAGSTSGARRTMILRRITIPMMTPALLGAFVYLTVNVVDTLDVPLVLGVPAHEIVLSSRVYLTARPPTGLPDYGHASVYGVMMVLLAIVPLLVYNKIIARSDAYVTVRSRAREGTRIALGRWRPAALSAVFLYVTIGLVLPFAVLFWVSIQRFYHGVSWAALRAVTFEGYTALKDSGVVFPAVLNTLLLGIAAGVTAVGLSALTSWLIVRSRSRAAWVLDFLAFMPHAFPGVAIGLSIALIYLTLPIPIYGTIWIIVVAMATQYVSLGTRLTTSGLVQVQESLEHAAAMSGARMRTTWRRVLLPLLRPTFTNSFLLVFLASIQNLTLPLMLQSPDNTVVSTLLWGRWYHGDVTGAAVLSVLMTLVTVTAAAMLRTRSRE